MKFGLFCQLIKEHKYSFDLAISFESILKKLFKFEIISVFWEKLVIFWRLFCCIGCSSVIIGFFSDELETKGDDIIFLFKFKNILI